MSWSFHPSCSLCRSRGAPRETEALPENPTPGMLHPSLRGQHIDTHVCLCPHGHPHSGSSEGHVCSKNFPTEETRREGGETGEKTVLY